MYKRVLLPILVLWLNAVGFSQIITYTTTTTTTNGINNCTTPVSTTFFQREYGNISATTNGVTKLSNAITFASSNCLSSMQVKQITMLFYSDQDKLDFCKAAYKNTVDKENFYDVYDAFAYFSTVFRLHDFVLSARGTVTTPNTTTNNTNTYYTYPAYTYPDYTTYLGITGCSYPMDENTFYANYASFMASKVNENQKVINIKDFININCLSTAQIMKLTSMILNETSRLDILKAGYPRVYDRANYSFADQLLTLANNKLDFSNMIYGKPGGTTTTTTVCAVTDNEMNDIKATINNSSFDNTKLTVGKQAVAAKKCFTVKQIKEILGLYSFESTKLEMAKYCYDYCSDKSNYYQVNDVFSFSSSKDDLTKYVSGK